MGRPATDKRERLVAAATERFHHAGSARTSLGEVANVAGVPPGNVFYYFKTKDELAEAVVDEWCASLTAHLLALDSEPDPWARLQAFIAETAEFKDWYVQWGCPFAGLARDFRQIGGSLAANAPRPYAVQLDWIERQFRAAGIVATDANGHARFVLSAIHGSILLAHAWDDETFLLRGLAQLNLWLDSLPRNQTA